MLLDENLMSGESVRRIQSASFFNCLPASIKLLLWRVVAPIRLGYALLKSTVVRRWLSVDWASLSLVIRFWLVIVSWLLVAISTVLIGCTLVDACSHDATSDSTD